MAKDEMSDKIGQLKCPFCGTELTGREDPWGGISDVWLECPNDGGCEHAYNALRFDVWQALIDGKAAQDVLAGIGKILLLHTNKPTVLTVKGKQEIRRRIASITKQDNKTDK